MELQNVSFQSSLSAQSSQGRFRKKGAAALSFGSQLSAARSQTAMQISSRTMARTVQHEVLPFSLEQVQEKLAKLREEGEKADYTGMSYGEISKAIRERYNEAFGEATMSFITLGHAFDDEIVAINNQYAKEMNHHVSYPLQSELEEELGFTRKEDCEEFAKYYYPRRFEVRREALGYGGMDDEEVKAAVFKKYAGKDSILDFLNLQTELHQTGVLCNKMGFDAAGDYYGQLRRQIDWTYFWDYCYNTVNVPTGELYYGLSQKFDPAVFFSDMRETVEDSTFRYYSYDAKGQLLQNIQWMKDLFL